MAKRTAARGKQHTQEDVIRTNVGVSSGQRAPETFARGAGIREYSSWPAALSEINAKGVAGVPLRLYARKRGDRKMLVRAREVPRRRKAYLLGDGKRHPSRVTMEKFVEFGSDFVEIPTHAVLDLMYAVNPWMCGFELMHQTALFGQLDGNAYWFKVRGPLGVEALWPLPPQWTWVIPDVGRYIAGYEYRPRGSAADAIRFDADEVVHFRMPNPHSLFYGMGNVQRAWLSTLANRAKHEMDVAFYENYGRPDVIWIIKNTTAQTAQLDEFLASTEQRLKGHRKHGRQIAVTGEVDVKNLQWSPKDMATEETTVEEMCAIWGVPVSMAMSNDPNRASAGTGYLWWREQTVAPLCCLTADVLNQNLLPDFGIEGDAVLAYDDPVPENEEQDAKVVSMYVQFGLKTPNEGREELGLEPDPNPVADELCWNGQPLGSAPTALMAPQDGNVAGAGGSQDGTKRTDGAPPGDGGVDDEKAKSLIDRAVTKAIEEYERRKSAPTRVAETDSACSPGGIRADAAKHTGCAHGVARQSDLLFSKGASDTARDDEDERVLRQFIRSLDAIGRKQAEAIVARMRRVGADPRAILVAAQMETQRSEWTRAIAEAAKPYVMRQATVGGQSGAALLGPEFSFDAANPEVGKYVDRATARLASGVQGTTQVRVRDLLQSGLDEGATIDELADRVMQSGVTVDPARAETIARTESARAYVGGQIESWKQSGVVVGKTWALAPDACEFCRAAARAGGSGIDQPFYRQGETINGVSGGSLLLDYDDVDGPPLHPNCLLPETPVLARGVVAAFRAWYRGKAVELSLSDGRRLSVTANHMLLTPSGFVRASSIRDGDDVVDCGPLERVVSRHPDNHLRPRAIEDVVRSLAMSDRVSSARVPVASEHLHGDGAFCDGDIDVVATDCLLRSAVESAPPKGVDHLPLCAGWSSDALDGLCDLDAMLVGLSLAAHGFVSAGGERASLGGRHLGMTHEHGLRSTALLEASAIETAHEGPAIDAEPLRRRLDAFSGLVTATKVVNVNAFDFEGHVYDLQTESGLHIDNGILTSNCRCAILPVIGEP